MNPGQDETTEQGAAPQGDGTTTTASTDAAATDTSVDNAEASEGSGEAQAEGDGDGDGTGETEGGNDAGEEPPAEQPLPDTDPEPEADPANPDSTDGDTPAADPDPDAEEPAVDPDAVETAADTDDEEDEDDGVITLVDEDKAETRYTLRSETDISGSFYRALNLEEGGDTVYFRVVRGDASNDDKYFDVEDDELGDVMDAFAKIFAADDAADELERAKVSGAVAPDQGEAATPG